LLAWHNLAWIDPLFWDDPEIQAWLKQGRNFSLSDRQRIYSKQRQILHKLYHNIGKCNSRQLEVTTTPILHPILPLLADTNAGRVAVPNMTAFSSVPWAEDIPRHLQKAWDLYQDRFGQTPRGLWPLNSRLVPRFCPTLPSRDSSGFAHEAVLGWTLSHFSTAMGWQCLGTRDTIPTLSPGDARI